MERLTTDANRFFEELKKELMPNPYPQNEDCIFTFCQIGQLLDHAYSMRFFDYSEPQMIVRKWNAALDGRRYVHICNLDRLAVTGKEITPDKPTIHQIQRLFKPEDFLIVKPDNLILDGLYCELQMKNKNLRWNCDEQMNVPLSNFVNHLRNQA